MSAVKAEDKLEGSKGHGTPMTEFHGFDLVAMGIPIDARPLSGDQHFGKFGYTIRSRKGAVICFSKATFCCLFGEQYLFSQMCRCISFKHGLYLMKASNLAQVVECLLKQKAFVVKKVSDTNENTENFKKGQVSWNKFGGVEQAWMVTKERSGFQIYEQFAFSCELFLGDTS